jgi:hypothetical protein
VSYEVDRRVFRLLPSEVVRWVGRSRGRARSERSFRLALLFLFATANVAFLFALLLVALGDAGSSEPLAFAVLLAVLGAGLIVLNGVLSHRGEYVITDRRVIVRRRGSVHAMDRGTVTFARIVWHPKIANVGDLELVVAVPIGPLKRTQRLVLEAVEDPDVALAVCRGVALPEHPSDRYAALVERLSASETVEWGGHPQGLLVGWREIATAGLGLFTLGTSALYGVRIALLVVELEAMGLAPLSAEWWLLVVAVGLSFALMATVGAGLIWYGTVRARGQGKRTEYLVTNERVMIRRGNSELSVDRDRIVDVATTRAPLGKRHLHLVLESAGGRALAASGAFALLAPAREPIPPVLYEVGAPDVEALRRLILRRPLSDPG